MSGRGPSWSWSPQHNGKFWDMRNRLAELEQKVADMQKKLDRLDPPLEEKVHLGMKAIFAEEWVLPHSYIMQEQVATEP